MCTISIANILASSSDLTQAGTQFYNRLISALNESRSVVVDMTDVSALPSIFLNVSLGKIIDDRGMELLKSNVRFSHINRTQAQRIKEYLAKFS